MLAVAVAAAAAAVSASASGVPVPPKDSFHGTITGATGSLRNDAGRVAIKVLTGTSTGSTESVRLKLSGRRCSSTAHCLQLTGTVSGTMTRQSSIPDVGAAFSLSASGKVAPLGHVSVSGQVHGTGFIAHGHESMTLRLSGAGGTVKVTAQSGLVPGFTSP
jgi:hypothetical protein